MSTNVATIKLLLPAGETAKALGICDRSLWKLNRDKKLLPRYIGGRKMFAIEDIQAFIQSAPTTPPERKKRKSSHNPSNPESLPHVITKNEALA